MASAAVSVLKAVVVAGVVIAIGSDTFFAHVSVALFVDLVFELFADRVEETKMNKEGEIGAGILRGHWCVDRIRIKQL